MDTRLTEQADEPLRGHTPPLLYNLVYCSRATEGVDAAAVDQIIETSRRSFDTLGTRKRLERIDAYVSGILGRVDMSIYWRADQNQKWRLADSMIFCAQVNDPEGATPHVFRNLVAHMMENPATISSAAQLLFVARNLERVGDHATNVAELVYYAATGDYYQDRDMPRNG